MGVLALLVGGGVSLSGHWSDQQTLAQAVDSAKVVSDLAVRSHVEPDHRTGISTPNLLQVFDIQQDVNRLHADRRLVGVMVWRADGTLLFDDAGLTEQQKALSRAVLQRAVAGRSSVLRTRQHDGQAASLDVYLPYLDDSGRGAALAKILLPEQQVTADIRAATLLLRACFLALVLAVVVALLTLRRRLRAREHQARHDALTGLLNRAALLEDHAALLQARSAARPRSALLIIDLDRFKTINDTLGHAAGDLLLAQVGRTLRGSVRSGDLVARLGGDEFAVVLRDLGPGQDAAPLAFHLLATLRAASFTVESVTLAVDASIGVAVSPEHGRTVEELLQHADVAMYESKSTHRGVTTYDPACDHYDVGQLGALVELREALDGGQLVLHFQPQLDLSSGAVVGAEALVRWNHPTRGLLLPQAFIPLAEPTGLIHPLTEWVLRAAVGQAVRWRGQGHGLRVAVNISPRSLLEGDLPGTVRRALAEGDLAAHRLELEITETAVMGDPERAAAVLTQLRAMGVGVAIDDFGVGQSSLAYLRRLPVTVLKLDRSIITHLLERPEDEAVTDAIIGLGHRLGLQVVAEGVETAGVQSRLTTLGCDTAQGYGISRPLPADVFDTWLAERAATATQARAALVGAR